MGLPENKAPQTFKWLQLGVNPRFAGTKHVVTSKSWHNFPAIVLQPCSRVAENFQILRERSLTWASVGMPETGYETPKNNRKPKAYDFCLPLGKNAFLYVFVEVPVFLTRLESRVPINNTYEYSMFL